MPDNIYQSRIDKAATITTTIIATYTGIAAVGKGMEPAPTYRHPLDIHNNTSSNILFPGEKNK